MKAGFVGLGIMGRPQALNLLKPGAALAAQAFNALMARASTRWDSAAILQVIEDMNDRAE